MHVSVITSDGSDGHNVKPTPTLLLPIHTSTRPSTILPDLTHLTVGFFTRLTAPALFGLPGPPPAEIP